MERITESVKQAGQKTVICEKCNGSGKYQYKSGMIGHCYACNGRGRLQAIEHTSYLITIINNEGERINWLHVCAKSEREAIRKAKTTAARGSYAENAETIKATAEGKKYTYRTIK